MSKVRITHNSCYFLVFKLVYNPKVPASMEWGLYNKHLWITRLTQYLPITNSPSQQIFVEKLWHSKFQISGTQTHALVHTACTSSYFFWTSHDLLTLFQQGKIGPYKFPNCKLHLYYKTKTVTRYIVFLHQGLSLVQVSTFFDVIISNSNTFKFFNHFCKKAPSWNRQHRQTSKMFGRILNTSLTIFSSPLKN